MRRTGTVARALAQNRLRPHRAAIASRPAARPAASAGPRAAANTREPGIAARHKAYVHGFPPIAAPDATRLILGSMPGKASLLANQYYAHPRNAFWPIMGELFGAPPAASYARRLRVLQQAGIAVWDVLAACTREGSLDADIDEDSIVPNDFARFFRMHPRIGRVFFNGARAELAFRRHVLPNLADTGVYLVRLPSTSPANASWSPARKLRAWRIVAANEHTP